MSNKVGGKSKFWLGVGLVFVFLSFLASFLASDVSKFYGHLNKFSYSVRNYDHDEAKLSLADMKSDYNSFVAWKMQYFADKFLFKEANLREAAVAILAEDYEKVEKVNLKDEENNHLASYMLGIAKFKALHAAFQQAMAKNDKKQMDTILGLVLEEVRSDFKKCVEKGPGPGDNFNCSFNYDLTSDPNSAKKALMNQKSKPKYVLGPPDGKEKAEDGKEKGKKEPLGLTPNEKKEAGQGGAKKVG
ncbi:MAG: hypothetical protein HYT63_03700 [Candidatus Yanofskybacteria bacterium]|nr:hypothetical protein [Candidatus Yanofskybacteria bacterium]